MRASFFVCLAAILFTPLASAQEYPTLDQLIRDWEALPENLDMREVCSNELRYSTEIVNLKSHGATVITLLRWAEQESGKAAAQVQDKTLTGGLSIQDAAAYGTEKNLMEMIIASNSEQPIYSKVRGGFPQWAYRSCLKDKPIER